MSDQHRRIAFYRSRGRARGVEEGLARLCALNRAERTGTRRSRRDAPTGTRRSRRTRLRVGLWSLAGLGVLLALLVAGVAGYVWYLNSEIRRVDIKGLASTGVDAEAGSENILLLGSTSRCALKVQNPAYGLCSQNAGINSDVVMIVHLQPSTHRVSLLSIPRDTFVPNARAEGANKIDAGLYDGPGQLVASIEEDFGIPIQHFVELNFDTFANIVDAVGGVRMYFPMPVYDQFSGLDVTTPGCHLLNGVEALQVVRARHLQYKAPGVTSVDPETWPQEAESDLARIRRDHEFLRVIVSALAHRGLGNPVTDLELVSSVAPQLEVDSAFSMDDIANLLLTFHGVDPNKAPELTIPIATSTFGSYVYEGGIYGDVVFPTEPEDQNVIDEFLGVSDSTDTMTGAPLPSPSSVRVAVLNGTGVSGQAASTAAALGRLGFQIAGVGNSSPVSPEADETVVYYAGPAEQAAAEAVARKLAGFIVMGDDGAMVTPGSDVTVETGTDQTVTVPASTNASSKSAPVSADASAVSASPVPAGFQAPSAAQQPLAPWDPRSCTASGGSGS